MSPDDKVVEINDFQIPRLFERRPKTNKRQFRYCDETHGAILNALLDRADGPNDLDAVLSQGFNRFQILMEKCNLGPRGRGYKKTTLPTIRRCVDWVRAQALLHGALISTPNGLVRVPGHSFKTDTEATEWLEAKITARARPRVSKRSRSLPCQHQPTSPAESLPALETLSLSDNEPAEIVTPNNAPRRVSFSQPSLSRSRSSSRTRRFVRRRTDELRDEGRVLRF
ncbi:hypothetical protein B0J15DRAFT_272517 [Fusarium solani]|uniref:Uncharacterized protein n=1 Tax=Fusarium solani TaxID=169388 RepID=A0A9P9KIV1_FUSSL|nr:uncharacterized protein B0J15DRAFT_272517 [Fusarium solani]KAH7264612.1 hypothetical protein B0J15DRAFT_272517 [Fusarium solani]